MPERRPSQIILTLGKIGEPVSRRFEALARGVNRIIEKAFEKGIISVSSTENNRITKHIEGGREVNIEVLAQRDLGTNYVYGVCIVMTEYSSGGASKDLFYSLDENGDNFWHIQSTPFLGEVLETRDTSLKRLIPYQKEVMDALSFSRKAKRIMQTGFDHLQTS